jgi:hypothetical protein
MNNTFNNFRNTSACSVSTNVPESSFVSVTEDEVFIAVMSIKSNAAGVDTLTHVFNHIFSCSEFPARWEGLCGAANQTSHLSYKS